MGTGTVAADNLCQPLAVRMSTVLRLLALAPPLVNNRAESFGNKVLGSVAEYLFNQVCYLPGINFINMFTGSF